MKKRNLRPRFKTEAEERKFWETHDSTDYIDWSKAERVRFPNLAWLAGAEIEASGGTIVCRPERNASMCSSVGRKPIRLTTFSAIRSIKSSSGSVASSYHAFGIAVRASRSRAAL